MTWIPPGREPDSRRRRENPKSELVASTELKGELRQAKRGCKLGLVFWMLTSFGFAFACIAVERMFRSMGVEFHQIAQYWRWGLIGGAVVLVGVAMVAQQLMQREYLVRVTFSGAEAPKDLEVSLMAASEPQAREKAAKHAEEVLERQGLFSFVTFTVTSCQEVEKTSSATS